MAFTRRDVMIMGTGAAIASALGLPASAATDELISAFTGGADVGEGGVMLTAPEIAENGNTVPIAVDAPGASSVMLLADGNPLPPVATFNFGPLAASQSGSTRIRLAKSQNVIAVAKMADGSFSMAKAAVKVTIGGCGG